jgi:hypothetical protein
MQTFLTYPSFTKTAKSLDYRRLGKQRVECYQILKALSDPDYGWQNHPAVKMWKDYRNALVEYGIAMCDEWISRGYKDTCREKIRDFYPYHKPAPRPHWLTDEFIRSHRSNLIRKMPEHYKKHWPNVPNNLEYVWPIKK